jgi:hypothetical protein
MQLSFSSAIHESGPQVAKNKHLNYKNTTHNLTEMSKKGKNGDN